MTEKADKPSPIVLGGSITTSPDGRLHTLQTHGMHASPKAVQQVWSNAKRRRYRKDWDGQPLSEVGYVIEWEPRQIACGACARSLGNFVAYRTRHAFKHAREEVGLVEDTTRRDASDNPRFRMDGDVLGRASKTSAHFTCRSCKATYKRNLSRLGTQLFESTPQGAYLLE